MLGRAALETLPEDVTTPVLASAARRLLSSAQIEAALLEASPASADLPEPEIDEMLSKAAQKALSDIIESNYHAIADSDAKEIVDLGLAVYGYGQRVKAVFAPGGAAGPGQAGV